MEHKSGWLTSAILPVNTPFGNLCCFTVYTYDWNRLSLTSPTRTHFLFHNLISVKPLAQPSERNLSYFSINVLSIHNSKCSPWQKWNPCGRPTWVTKNSPFCHIKVFLIHPENFVTRLKIEEHTNDASEKASCPFIPHCIVSIMRNIQETDVNGKRSKTHSAWQATKSSKRSLRPLPKSRQLLRRAT